MSGLDDHRRGARWRATLTNPVLTLVSLLAGLAIAELALRIGGIGYGYSPVEASRRLQHVHPRSYEFVVYNPAREFGGNTVRYDAEGYRISGKPQPAAPRRRIAFLGDSFTEVARLLGGHLVGVEVAHVVDPKGKACLANPPPPALGHWQWIDRGLTSRRRDADDGALSWSACPAFPTPASPRSSTPTTSSSCSAWRAGATCGS